LQEAPALEEKLLEISNELGKPLNFSLLLLPQRAMLTGYFKDRKASLEQLKLIGMAERAQHGFLRDRDWQDSVKKHFKPLIYRNVAWVPVWQKKFDRKGAKTVLRFDPGMAFGTGNHPTTRLCLRRLVELMAEYMPRAKDRSYNHSVPTSRTKNSPTVLDIGCGSGILAITADKLGAKKAEGFDLDEHSIVVAKRNTKLNHSSARCFVGDLYKDKLVAADIVFANLLANLIEDNAKKLWAAVKPGGTLVLSGLLKEELEKIAALFPCPARLHRLGKWGAVVVRKN